MRLLPGLRAVWVKPRASPPDKAAWMLEREVNLETAGMFFSGTRRRPLRGTNSPTLRRPGWLRCLSKGYTGWGVRATA